MDALNILAGTAEAAFATNEKGVIVGWNKAAETLLDYEEAQVLGKRCHEVVCGKDLFGNRFCDVNCPVANMTRRDEAVHGFELDLQSARSETIRADVSIIVIPGKTRGKFTLVHLVRVPSKKRPHENPGDDSATGEPAEQNPNSVPVTLTRRQIEVLGLLADGANIKEIAQRLNASPSTVRNHIQGALDRLDAHSRLEAIIVARRHGLI